jgi:hypothetical protein
MSQGILVKTAPGALYSTPTPLFNPSLAWNPLTADAFSQKINSKHFILQPSQLKPLYYSKLRPKVLKVEVIGNETFKKFF